MGIRSVPVSRSVLIFFSLILMLAGMLFSRALLSIGTIAFPLLCCFHGAFPQQLRQFSRQPLLVGMSLLFLVPLLSGLWSVNKAEWGGVLRIKLPLLVMPLAFAGNWTLTAKQWRSIALLFFWLVVAGAGWSFVQFLLDPVLLTKGYSQAKTIPTPLENDHVRFSWLVTVAIMGLAYMWKAYRLNRWLYGAAGLFLLAYLHLLAARTGLLAFYLFVAVLLVYQLTRLRLGRALGLLALALLLPVAAWFLFPTIQKRYWYFLYDLSHVRTGQYLPGSNDGNRVMSIRAGWDILQTHPGGVGAGDLKDTTLAWYARQLPAMLESDKFYPSSEWLVYGGFAGWAGVAVFSLALLLPFFQKLRREHVFWISLNIIAASSFLFDIGLEVQFGVFLYAFIVLWWWRWLQEEPEV